MIPDKTSAIQFTTKAIAMKLPNSITIDYELTEISKPIQFNSNEIIHITKTINKTNIK